MLPSNGLVSGVSYELCMHPVVPSGDSMSSDIYEFPTAVTLGL